MKKTKSVFTWSLQDYGGDEEDKLISNRVLEKVGAGWKIKAGKDRKQWT